MESLNYRPEKALSKTIELKRGITDTAEPGAFTKTLVYFRGLRAIEQFVASGGDMKRLYIGKVSLEDLDVLKDIDGGPRIAVLGDMFELGNAEQVAHEEVGCRAGIVADWVIGVGERARWICRAAIECGRPAARVLHANSNAEALQLLKTVIRGKSVILVKGSRGMQMEEIVEGLGEMTN